MTIFKYLFSFSRASVVENGRKHTHTAFSRWRMETHTAFSRWRIGTEKIKSDTLCHLILGMIDDGNLTNHVE